MDVIYTTRGNFTAKRMHAIHTYNTARTKLCPKSHVIDLRFTRGIPEDTHISMCKVTDCAMANLKSNSDPRS